MLRPLEIALPCVLLAITTPCGADEPEEPPHVGPKVDVRADLLYGAIDPLLEGRERVKFVGAIASDTELVPEEFKTDQRSGAGSIRSFDRWEELLKYDKNRNGAIDWFEFLDYRTNFRLGVLYSFDANDNRRLEGRERQEAIEAVRSGWVPPLMARKGEVKGSVNAAKLTSDDNTGLVDPITYTTKLTFAHGASYVHVRNSLTKADLPKLYAMLDDPEYAPHWHRIAETIALLSEPGDEKSVDVLIQYIKRSDGEFWKALPDPKRWTQAMGKVQATSWIGRLGPQRPDVRAMLESALTPEGAQELIREWYDDPLPRVMAKDKPEEVLAMVQGWAALGLVLTGDEQAIAKVRKLQEAETNRIRANPNKFNFFNGLSQAAGDADFIAERGLNAYLELTGSGDEMNQMMPYYEKYMRAVRRK